MFSVHSLFLFIFSSLYEFFFLNEELLIAICMLLVFFFLVKTLRKTINFFFFFKVESIYFSFLNLILLNLKLINKMLNILNLEILRFETILIFQLYSFFSEFSNKLLSLSKTVYLSFFKNFVLFGLNQLYTLNYFVNSNNYLVSILDNFSVFTAFSVSFTDLLNETESNEIVDLYLTDNLVSTMPSLSEDSELLLDHS